MIRFLSSSHPDSLQGATAIFLHHFFFMPFIKEDIPFCVATQQPYAQIFFCIGQTFKGKTLIAKFRPLILSSLLGNFWAIFERTSLSALQFKTYGFTEAYTQSFGFSLNTYLLKATLDLSPTLKFDCKRKRIGSISCGK